MNQIKTGVSQEEILRIKMFGGFSMTWGREKLVFARSGNKKFIQLLQLLFLNYEEGIEKKAVLEALYDGAAGAVDNKNLNNVIYRLKKQLVLAGLPEGEEYITLKKGVLRWRSSFPVEIDTVRMRQLVNQASGLPEREQMKVLRRAEAEYTGELLPEFSAETWVVEQNQYYKLMYEQTVRRICGFLERNASYEEAGEIYQKAAALFPADEWQLKVIDCLLEQGRSREAQEVYREAVRFFCEEMGLPPGNELLKRLRRIEEQMIHPTESFKAIQEQVQEQGGEGAYYCLLPSFIDSCRIIVRMAERSGQSVFLMLLNLNDGSGNAIEDSERLLAQMELLKETIRRVLRRGDLYTRYSRNQFLIILIGTEQENCQKAFTRLQNEWKRTEGHKGVLSFSVESLLRMAEEPLPEPAKPSWGRKGSLWK